MPRIADRNLDGVAFLFRTRDEAEARSQLGGSAFFIGRAIAGSENTPNGPTYVPYLISNRHVVWNTGAPFASLNRRDGNPPDVIEIDQTEWHVHPSGADLAAVCMLGRFDRATHKTTFLQDKYLLTKEFMHNADIGVGDEVFMMGRFLNHQGQVHNRPAARFGSLSMMLEPLWNDALKRDEEGFAVEMRSRTGFSGSPVTVYRTPATVLTDVPEEHRDFFRLLGVNWGYVLDQGGENTWLNGVVPAWKIVELLEGVPELRKQQDHATDEFFRLMRSGTQSAATTEGAPESSQTFGAGPPGGFRLDRTVPGTGAPR